MPDGNLAPVIRPLVADDWEQVHAIVVEVATEGHSHAIEVPGDVSQTRECWTGDLLVVAVDGETVLGCARAGSNYPGPGAHVGTASFMVPAQARGRGVGRLLGEHVVEWHRQGGARAIQFNAVVSTNHAAVRLWHSLGFRTVGTVPDAFALPGGKYADLHVMHLDLVRSPTPTGRDDRRTRVLETAARQFSRHGWAGTGLDDVALQSGVPVPEVVQMFGSAADLLMAAYRWTSFGERSNLQSSLSGMHLEQLPDLDARLDSLADFASTVLPRMAPLAAALTEAAGTDPTALAIRQGVELRRLGVSKTVVSLISRDGEPAPDAVPVVQMLTSAETFLAFRLQGWEIQRYRQWLRDALDHAVNRRVPHEGSADPAGRVADSSRD